MCPVLVIKSTIKTLINFLINNNSWYQQCRVAYSEDNMNDLFAESDGDGDVGVPQVMEVCHLPQGDNISESETATIKSHNTTAPDDTDSGDIVTEAIEFTQGEHSLISRDQMKLHALAYILNHKQFLLSRAGSQFVSDSHLGLMSFLFPYLDPWNIRGFNHSGHMPLQHISIKVQVKNLLHQDDLPFIKDSNFAFICWNMFQTKKQNLAKELKDIAPSLTSLMENTKEKKAVMILCYTGYKLCQHNEISLFVTVNLYDLTSSMFPIITELQGEEWSNIHPDAIALVFDLQI
ncbi:hypothetical protein BDR06DRAFT_985081 [Suillus hirtellus]|nr:hypothetical protein BDR06DRAFT_985081 [Suillus hirtellus]